MASISWRLAIAIALGLVGRASCLRVGSLRTPSRLSVMTQMRVQAETKQLAAALAMFAAAHLGGLQPAFADGSTETFKFPPIDSKKVDRCKFVSSAMGQANAARDSLYDLRECKMDKMSAGGFDISGALLASGSFKGTDFKEAQLSKVYAPEATFDGADFTDAVVDRAYFKGASFKGVKFINTVLTSTSFEDADLTDTDFTGSYLGQFDAKKLCKNPTLKGTHPQTGVDTKESAGC